MEDFSFRFKAGTMDREAYFVRVEFKGGRLSICGDVYRSGHDVGGGQCVDLIKRLAVHGNLCAGVTTADLLHLVYLWDRWHLNDMRAYCEHQGALGWDDEARQQVPMYSFKRKHSVFSEMHSLERDIVARMARGETIEPNERYVTLSALPWRIESPVDTLPENISEYYDHDGTQFKGLGWLRESEHPRGLLCRPCPVCGYKYGSSWLREDVPSYVLDWLRDFGARVNA
jgi:hypothetical protein